MYKLFNQAQQQMSSINKNGYLDAFSEAALENAYSTVLGSYPHMDSMLETVNALIRGIDYSAFNQATQIISGINKFLTNDDISGITSVIAGVNSASGFSIQEAMNKFESDHFALEDYVFKLLSQNISGAAAAINALLPEHGNIFKAQLISEAISANTTTTASILNSLENTGNPHNVIGLSQLFLRPVAAYKMFADDTVALFADAVEARESLPLGLSLAIAKNQIIKSTEVTTSLISSIQEEYKPNISRPIDFFEIQRTELLDSFNFPYNTDQLQNREIIQSKKYNSLARKALSLYIECNENSKLKGEKEIFTLTNRVLEATNELPYIVPADKKSFSIFIDYIYFMVYEAAGSDKLRYHYKSGGILDDEECQFVWRVKHIRNKWLRHDPDHGRDIDIRKNWEDLKKTFNSLGFNGLPSNEDDFNKMSNMLLNQFIEFLERLKSKL